MLYSPVRIPITPDSIPPGKSSNPNPNPASPHHHKCNLSNLQIANASVIIQAGFFPTLSF